MNDPRELAAAFVAALRRMLPGLVFTVEDDGGPVVTIPARHPAVGSVIIDFAEGEVTVGIGDHFHCHFDPEESRVEGDPSPIEASVEAAATYVHDFLEDRILFHIVFVNGAYGGSGTAYLDSSEPLPVVPDGAELYTWSGPWHP